MERLQLTGGARIGWVHTIWPLATLTVTPELLSINSNIMGVFHFFPGDIVSIEPITFIPLIARGIRIRHNKSKYDSKVIFWAFHNPESLIRHIEGIGFWFRNKKD